MRDDAPRTARAFAPGHVTGVFAPSTTAHDPRGRGSVGAGIVLELGVHAVAVHRPSGAHRFRLTSDRTGPLPISSDVGRRLAAALPGSVEVRLTHELPVGQGFGTSASGATATALALSRLGAAARREAVTTAHLADLFGGGGLGGVAAILGGGLEVRVRAGLPPRGDVRHFAFRRRVLVGVVGPPLPSPRILGDPRRLARIARASEGWEALVDDPSPERFFAFSETFTDRVGLAPPQLRAILKGLRRRRTYAAQAMFGATFLALPETRAARRAAVEWLGRAGVPTVELGSDRRGARSSRGTGRAVRP